MRGRPSGVTLAGRVVTAVFYKRLNGELTQTIDYFYIEEPDRSGGIKVEVTESTSPSPLVLEPGYEVTVTGDVQAGITSGSTSDPECHIDADTVSVTGLWPLPVPLRMNGRTAAGAVFGLQPGLYQNAVTQHAGFGLNGVGLRARAWGVETATGTESLSDVSWRFVLDDIAQANSGLRRTYSSVTRDGLRVSYPTDAVELGGAIDRWEIGNGSYYCAATGILGAEISTEMSGVNTVFCAVPVLKIPNAKPALGIIYVWHGSTAQTPDGNTWASAFHTVTEAISSSTSGDEIWVAADTYAEYITLPSGVAMYGGFAATETTREQRNWVTNETILNGDPGYSVVTTSWDCSAATRIDGFTITNGNCGIMVLGGGEPTIANNLVTGNHNSGEVLNGGGIYCDQYSSPVITSNTVRANTAEYAGGGLYCAASSSPRIMGNMISKNSALSGGGIDTESSSALISRNTIEWNSAASGGGIVCSSSSDRINGNTIMNNTGGGISCDNNEVVTNNLIAGNTGNGADLINGAATFINNTVVHNTACGVSVSNATPTVTNNIIALNETGGIDIYTGFTLSYNDIWENNDQWQPGSPDTNRSDDPLFVDSESDFHILSLSPCRNNGDNGVSDSVVGVHDLDGGVRRNGPIDIGAYETCDGMRYIFTLTSEATRILQGSAVKVTAYLFDVVANQSAHGVSVDISADAGEIISVTRDGVTVTLPAGTRHTYGITGTDGKIDFYVTRADQGYVHLTSTITPCGMPVSRDANIWFEDPDTINMLFCIDCTGSMTSHWATDSVKGFLDDMSSEYGLRFVAGMVKFNNSHGGTGMDDFIDTDQEVSLSTFTNLGDFESVLTTDYTPSGGDRSELQLDALEYAAQDMAANAVSTHRYVVLITDDTYHSDDANTSLVPGTVIDDLVNPLKPCRTAVFLSLWDLLGHLYDPGSQLIPPPAYNVFGTAGCIIDPPDYDATDTEGDWLYPLQALRDAIAPVE